MSAPLDTQKVRTALSADPAFSAGMPEEARKVFLELVDALPSTLEGQLDRKVALSSLMEAKLAVIERMLASGFAEKLFSAVPRDALPFSAPEMAAMMVESLTHLRMPLMEMIRNTDDFLAEYGVTERQMLASAQGGRFDARTLAAYDAGTLTIRALLETQPAALLLNGDG